MISGRRVLNIVLFGLIALSLPTAFDRTNADPPARSESKTTGDAELKENAKRMAKAAEKTFDWCYSSYEAWVSGVSDIHDWSVKWMMAEMAASDRQCDKIKAAEMHLARMTRLHETQKHRDSPVMSYSLSETEFYVLEAQRTILELGGEKPSQHNGK